MIQSNKTLSKLGTERNFFNMVSDIYNKPIVLITLYDEEKKISP